MPIPRIAIVLPCLLAPTSFSQDDGPARGGSELGQQIAEPIDQPPADTILDWSVRIQPRAWLASAAGDLRMPGGSAEMTLDTLNLDEASIRPVLELDVQRDRWRMTVTGFYLDEDSSITVRSGGSLGGVGFSAGDRLASSLEYFSVEAMGSYEIWRYDPEKHDRWPDLDTSVDLVAGVRFSSIEFNFDASRGSVGLGSSSARHLFATPIAGARWRLGLMEQFSLETELNAGGFTTGSDHSSFAFDVSTHFAYRPTPNLGALFGYRQLLSSFEDGSGLDSFEYSGATAGLYFGVELRY